MSTIERRRRRSTNTFEAITFQLEHIFEEEKLANFVLGDENGFLIAHAGRADDAHVLAAYAPLFESCNEKTQYLDAIEAVRDQIPELDTPKVAFRTFDVDGYKMHIAIQGAGNAPKHENIYRAVNGVRRILREERAAA